VRDAYASVAEADEYCAAVLGKEAWAELEEEVKGKALLSATLAIDACPLEGTPAIEGQMFPRWGYGLPLTDYVTVPEAVKQACIEEAYSLACVGTPTPDTVEAMRAAGIKRWKAGSTEGEFFAQRGSRPWRATLSSDEAARLLDPWLMKVASIWAARQELNLP
jgi:hypothetical protein